MESDTSPNAGSDDSATGAAGAVQRPWTPTSMMGSVDQWAGEVQEGEEWGGTNENEVNEEIKAAGFGTGQLLVYKYVLILLKILGDKVKCLVNFTLQQFKLVKITNSINICYLIDNNRKQYCINKFTLLV